MKFQILFFLNSNIFVHTSFCHILPSHMGSFPLSRAWRARPSSVSGSRLLASPPGVSSVLVWGRMGGTCGIHPTLYVLVPSPWPTHHLAPPQKPLRHRPSAINMPPLAHLHPLGDARGPFLPNHIFGDACGLRDLILWVILKRDPTTRDPDTSCALRVWRKVTLLASEKPWTVGLLY